MITPNGRFKENTRLCLSMSDYHPDLWNPGWSVATILNGLLSFMTGDEATTGSITTTEFQKRTLAKNSIHYNTYQNTRFKLVFPEVVKENLAVLEGKGSAEKDVGSTESEVTETSAVKAVNIDELVDETNAKSHSNAGGKTVKKESTGVSVKVIVGVAILVLIIGLSLR